MDKHNVVKCYVNLSNKKEISLFVPSKGNMRLTDLDKIQFSQTNLVSFLFLKLQNNWILKNFKLLLCSIKYIIKCIPGMNIYT